MLQFAQGLSSMSETSFRKRVGVALAITLVSAFGLGLQACSPQQSGVSIATIERAGLRDAAAARACQGWLDNSGPSSGDFTLLGAEPARLDDAKSLATSMGTDVDADPLYSRFPGDHAIVACMIRGPLEKMGYRGTELIYYVIPDLQSSGLIAER